MRIWYVIKGRKTHLIEEMRNLPKAKDVWNVLGRMTA